MMDQSVTSVVVLEIGVQTQTDLSEPLPDLDVLVWVGAVLTTSLPVRFIEGKRTACGVRRAGVE